MRPRPLRSAAIAALCALAGCHDSADLTGADAAVAAARVPMATPTTKAAFSDEIEIDGRDLVAVPHTRADAVAWTGTGWVAFTQPGNVVRVGSDGVPDPLSRLVLGSGPGAALRGALASDGTVTGVAYDGARGLEWHRLDAQLRPLDEEPVVLQQGSADFTPAVAFGADHFLIAWSDGNNIGLKRISTGGRMVDAQPVYLGRGTDPSVAWDGHNFLVVWSDLDDVRGARIGAQGAPLDDGITLVDRAAGPARVACGAGGIYLLTWTTRPAEKHVMGLRLSSGLAPLGAPFAISSTAPGSQQHEPAVSWSGSTFVVGWLDGVDGLDPKVAWSRRVDAQGVMTDPVRVSPAGAVPTALRLAAGGDTALVLWERGGTRLAASGPLDPDGIQLLRRAPQQGEPSAIAGPDGEGLVAWRDDRRYSDEEVHVRRVDADGGSLGPTTTIAGSRRSGDPFLGWNGERYLVGWGQLRAMNLARVAADGTVESVTSVATLAGAAYGSVGAAPGGDFLVTWLEQTGSGTAFHVYGAVIPADGSAPGPRFPIATAPGGQSQAAVLWENDHYRVLWRGDTGLRTMRIASDGTVLDPGGVLVSASAYAGAVVPTPAGTLLAWVQFEPRELRVGWLIDGAMPDPDGEPVLADPSIVGGLSAAFDGDGVTLMYMHQTPDFSHYERWATRLRADGAPVGGAFRVVDMDHLHGPAPLISSAQGKTLMLHTRYDDERPFEAWRVRGRRFTWQAGGEACTAAAECASGFCVDGVCCDGACGGGAGSDCEACSVAAGAPVDGRCALLGAERVCRAATGACDQAERCDGAAAACPGDAPADDGTACNDGDACRTGDVCTGGACGGAPVECPAPGPCEATVTCAPADGRCRAEPVADGTPCPGGTCGAGACVPLPDAGVPDAGTPDAGTPDAGTPDAGVPDAGTPDAGAPDAGAPDAGAPADAAPPTADARPLPDAAPVPDGDDGGCGCSAGDPSAGLVLSVVVGWLARRRRRR
jgi:hypothetical protein